MSSLSWRSSLVVHGYAFPSGDRVSVTVGLVDNAAGNTTVALRVGAGGSWVFLPIGEAGRLGVNVEAVLAERFQRTVNEVEHPDVEHQDLGDREHQDLGEREARGDGGDSSR